MPSLLRSGQIISQVLRDKTARAGFAPDFYTGLMRAQARKNPVNQSLPRGGVLQLMNVRQLISQGLRYTLR